MVNLVDSNDIQVQQTNDNIELNIDSGIKNTIQSIIDGEVYSTSEVKTSKVYIENGVEKPIYRNYIQVVMPSFPSSYSQQSASHGIPNISSVINWYAFKITVISNDSLVGYLPFMHSNGAFTVISSIDDTNVVMRSNGAFSGNTYNICGYIEYTKTTD